MPDTLDPSTTVIAYFECFSGASGDMILGALVDAGWPIESLRAALQAMPLTGWELDVSPTKKGALRATKVTIRVTAPQPERSVLQIVAMIEASCLSTKVKAQAIALFEELAAVEALQHAEEPDNVHFHEVGATDSILDIVGAVAGLEALGVTAVRVSPVNIGGGLVNTRDGILPVPGPATLELLRRQGIPMYSSEYGPEFLTPTGALILGCLSRSAGPFPPMTVERIGYGAGQKDFQIPNVLRVSIGKALAGQDPIGRVRDALASDAITGPIQSHIHRYAQGAHAHNHAAHAHDYGHAHDDGQSHNHAANAHDDDAQVAHDLTATESDLPSSILRDGQTFALRGYLEDEVVHIETNVDDMSGEWYGYLAETLMAEGALDVTLVPATMKKGRPATIVSVMVRPERTDAAVATLFRETTTLGLRIRTTRRVMLPRRSDVVQTEFGPIRVKVAFHGSKVRGVAPEYEDCRAAAAKAEVPLQAVMHAAEDTWRRTSTPDR
jgi:uncharacterized protein (DUF111 family)